MFCIFMIVYNILLASTIYTGEKKENIYKKKKLGRNGVSASLEDGKMKPIKLY